MPAPSGVDMNSLQPARRRGGVRHPNQSNQDELNPDQIGALVQAHVFEGVVHVRSKEKRARAANAA
jgi:hypothetical protein